MPTKRVIDRVRDVAPKVVQRATFAGVFADLLRDQVHQESQMDVTWPAGPGTRYYDRPDLFASEVLGMTLEPHQLEILADLVRYGILCLSGGRKVGKTAVMVVAALWWYCTRPTGRVFFVAVTHPQVDRVLWVELTKRVQNAKIAIDGILNDRAQTGLKARGGQRAIQSAVVGEREAGAGISGTEQLYIVDEASAVKDSAFATILGNMAGGGCKLVAISNPTRNEGWHFKVYHPSGTVRDAAPYRRVIEDEDTVAYTISSLDIAQRTRGRVPGLATLAYCEGIKKRYGEDSEEYVVHVLGRHMTADEGRAFSLELVTTSRIRYEVEDVDPTAPLVIGLDVAGSEVTADLNVLAARRGMKIFDLEPLPKGSDTGALLAALEAMLIRSRAYDREVAVVNFDVGGKIGWDLLPVLRDRAKAWQFKLNAVRASDNAVRYRDAAVRRSAELVWNFRRWMRAGGAIPDDELLADECRAWEFRRAAHDDERVKVDKDKVRALLGRSPDRFDACALAVWDTVDVEERQAAFHSTMAEAQQSRPAKNGKSQAQRNQQSRPFSGSRGLDPFSGRARRV